MIKKFALILPVLSGILWGSTGIFVRVLQDANFDSVTLTSSKIMLTTILLFLGILIFKREYFKIKLKDLWMFIGSGASGMLLLNFGYNAAVGKLTLSLAAVLLSLSPVFVMIFASIIFKEKVTVKKIVCTAFAVFGCALVSGILDGGAASDINFTGILLGLFAAVCYALYGIFSKMAMEKGYNVFTIIFYSSVFVSIVLAAFTDYSMIGHFISEAPVSNSLFMIGYAAGTAILPYIFYTLALGHVDAGTVAILGAGGEPSAAMIFGIIVYSEIPSILSVVGLIITISALTFICLPDKKDKAKK